MRTLMITAATLSLCAACVGSASNPVSSAPSGSSATAKDSATSTASVDSTAPSCTNSQLRVEVTHTSVAAGTVGGYLAFTNISRASCRLTGWPELVGSNHGSKSVPALHVRSAISGPDISGQPVVTLAPSEHADAAFAGGDNPGPGASDCPPSYTTFQVTPPGSTSPVTVPAWISYANTYMPACAQLVITMVVPPTDLYQG